MSWLHRLQQRISITRHEALTLISLSLFLMLGITGRHVCRSAETFGPETYAEVDSLFARQSAAVFDPDPPAVADRDSTDSVRKSEASPMSEASPTDDASPKNEASPKSEASPKNEALPTNDVSQNTYSNDETLAPEGAKKIPVTGRIDINRATASELVRLPRVGPKIAERILAFRTTFGPFRSLEELTSVRGIGPKTLELIRPHAYISDDLESGLLEVPDSTK